MEVYEGRSLENGTELYVCQNEGSFIISSLMGKDGKITVNEKTKFTSNKKFNKWRVIACLAILNSTFIIIGFSIFLEFALEKICFFGMLGILNFVLYNCFIEFYKKSNVSTLRYHTATHIVLNYYNKYGKLPETLENIAKTDKKRTSCIFSVTFCFLLIGFILLFIVALSINWWLKLLLIILCTGITFVAWASGVFNSFTQENLLLLPSFKELEVALKAMERFIEIQKEEEAKESKK